MAVLHPPRSSFFRRLWIKQERRALQRVAQKMRLRSLVQLVGGSERAEHLFRSLLLVVGILRERDWPAGGLAHLVQRDEPANADRFEVGVAKILALGVSDKGLKHHGAPPSCFFISAQSGTLTTPSLSRAGKKVMHGSGFSTLP